MCVLRASSNRKTLLEFLENARLPFYESHDKADIQDHGQQKGKPFGYSGFKCVVSEKDWRDLPGQIADAVRFLRRYKKDLEALRNGFKCDLRLDFPYESRIGTFVSSPKSSASPSGKSKRDKIFAQFDFLPPELISRAGELGIGIEMSLYPPIQPSRAKKTKT
jgi:hypothetical protein